MATNPTVPPTPDPQDLKLIEDYLKAAGLQGQILADRMKKVRDETIEFNRELVNARQHFARMGGEFRDVSDTLRNVVEDLSKSDNLSSRITKSFKGLNDLSDKLKYDAQEISKLDKQDLITIDKKIKTKISDLATQRTELELKFKNVSEDRLLTISQQSQNKELAKQAGQLLELRHIIKENGDLIIDENSSLNDQTNYLYKLLVLAQKRLKLEKNLQNAIGVTGAAIKGVENITRKLGISGLEDVFKEAREAAEKKAKALGVSDEKALSLSGKIKTMGAGLSTLAKGLAKTLTDPLVLLTAQITILKKAFNFYKGINQAITEQGRQLGISYKESRKLYISAGEYALAQKDGYTTDLKIIEGRKLLNDALETSIQFTDAESIEAKKLSEFYGLSGEQLQKMTILSARNGKTLTQTKNEVLKTAIAQKAQYGGTLATQKVVQKVNSISGDILTKFKGNVGALTAAVQQADRLGLTLEQVDKIGESLLNFETSIQNELKAELLTGKAINLEKARAAALSGDQAKLMNEIASQVGNIHQFEKMNVIQRQAYAEAFGMTASEMGDMLRKREFEAKYGKIEQENAQKILDKVKAQGGSVDDNIKKQLEQLSLQDKMNNVFSKLQTLLSRIIDGPMEKMFKILEKSLGFVEKLLKGFKSITGGVLGNALGGALLFAPLLIGGIRLLTGGMKSLLLGPRGSSPMNPMFVTMAQALGGMGSSMPGGFVPGLGFTGGKLPGGIRQNAAGRWIGSNGRYVSNEKLLAAQQQQGKMAMRNMGIGAGLSVGGMALQGIASNMEEGTGKNVMGVAGSTATYAGMGMMFGPIGAGIGALVGLGVGLFSLSKENEERRKQEMEQEKERNRIREESTKALIEQLTVRPVKLTVSNKEIGEFNTAASQYSGNGALAS